MKDEVKSVEFELCTLAGGMRGLARMMVSLSDDPGRGNRDEDMADLGYLVQALGEYVQRLSTDLDCAVKESDRGEYLHLDKSK